jgi:hypothetical protein
MALGIVIAVVCWLPNAGAAGPPMSAIRAGTLAFLAAQRGGIDLDGTRVTFVPLGMTAIVAIVLWRASSLLADVLERLSTTSRRDLVAAGAVQAASYAATSAVLAVIAPLGTTSVRPVPAATGAILLAGVVTAVSLGSTARRRGWAGGSAPDYVGPGLRAALGALCVYLGAASLLVAGSLVVHAGTVSQLSRMVGGGVSGIPLVVLGVLCAPNATIGAAAYLAGPGFAIGTGTSVTAFSASRGTLPAFPILGAIPSGNGPPRLGLVVLVVTLLAAGWVTARLARGSGPVDVGDLFRRIVVAAIAAGSAMAALGWLAGGVLGPGRLHTVGPSPWQFGIAVAGEIAVTSLVLIGLVALWRWSSVRLVAVASSSRRRARASGDEPSENQDRGPNEDSDEHPDEDPDEDEAALAG